MAHKHIWLNYAGTPKCRCGMTKAAWYRRLRLVIGLPPEGWSVFEEAEKTAREVPGDVCT